MLRTFLSFQLHEKSTHNFDSLTTSKNRNPEQIMNRSLRLSEYKIFFILMYISFLDPCIKKKHTTFTNIGNNFLRDCGTHRVPRCERKQYDPSIHRDSLLTARTLFILRDLRYYASSCTSNSTLSLRDFGHKFSQAPLSTLTPMLLDL